MGHFWVPALWKYSRATGDGKMKDILARYFAAGYAADPFREHEPVGVYSNAYLGYAYYFTRDPRFLPLVEKELESLLPYAIPLAKPEDINARLYNPYAPARTFTGLPRLLWALDTARNEKVKIGPRPLPPQRTLLAIGKLEGKEATASLWGFDSTLTLFGPDAKPYKEFAAKTEKYASEIQPFDRTLPQFEVYLHRLTIPATAPAGAYVVAPTLELAALNWSDGSAPVWNAAHPLALKPGEAVSLPVASDEKVLQLESAQPALIQLRDQRTTLLPGKVSGNRVTFALDGIPAGSLSIEMQTGPGWLRIVDRPAETCWVSPAGNLVAASGSDPRPASLPLVAPDRVATEAALPPPIIEDHAKTFSRGRFGSALQVVPKRAFHLPDQVLEDGVEKPLFNESQGTIEFWVRQQWDARLIPGRPGELLTNGLLTVPHPGKLKLAEWTHVAFVWAPYRGDPKRTINYVYVDGRDYAFYRSFNWDGYGGAKVASGPRTGKRLMEFVSRAAEGMPFSIDELRISSVARYADLKVEYGPRQTLNPVHFEPPREPFTPDPQTLLLVHFDDDLQASVPQTLPAGRLAE